MALASTRECSPAPGATPSGVGDSLPVDLTVLPWMATPQAPRPQPQGLSHICSAGPEGAHRGCPAGPRAPAGEDGPCHSHGTGQLLFFIVMGNL